MNQPMPFSLTPASSCATRLTTWATLFQSLTGEDAPALEAILEDTLFLRTTQSDACLWG